jgi:hypothetical protein
MAAQPVLVGGLQESFTSYTPITPALRSSRPDTGRPASDMRAHEGGLVVPAQNVTARQGWRCVMAG